MIADDWSLHLIERELSQLYAGMLAGRAPGLDAAPSYRAAISQAAPAPSAADLTYWAEKCRGARPVELVPNERLRRSKEPHRVRVNSVVVPATGFLRLVQANRVTLHTGLYAMIHALVAADTGAQEVLLNTVNAARRSAELERTVGVFVDTVLVRQRVLPNLSFIDSLRLAADELNTTYWHADATMPALCAELPDLLAVAAKSQPVVFETLAPVAGLQLKGCSIQRSDPYHVDYDGLPYRLPVGLNMIARQEGTMLRLAAFHDTAFLPAKYVDGMLHRMREIVLAYDQHGDHPMDRLVPADTWVREL